MAKTGECTPGPTTCGLAFVGGVVVAVTVAKLVSASSGAEVSFTADGCPLPEPRALHREHGPRVVRVPGGAGRRRPRRRGELLAPEGDDPDEGDVARRADLLPLEEARLRHRGVRLLRPLRARR